MLALFIAAFQMFFQPPAQEEPQQTDVCAFFSDPLRWNGKLIRVSGELELGHGEGGPWLSGRRCSAFIAAKGVKFPNLVELTNPNSKLKLHNVVFRWDEASWNRFVMTLSQVDQDSEHITATVIGVFETRDPLSDLIQNGQERGFGHLGGSPAQILVKTMPALSIVKNQ